MDFSAINNSFVAAVRRGYHSTDSDLLDIMNNVDQASDRCIVIYSADQLCQCLFMF